MANKALKSIYLSANKVVLLCLLLFLIAELQAQVSFPNKMQAEYIDGFVNVDGVLTDSVWAKATRISNFTQRELNLGEPASERTEVAIAYNEVNLYIAVWCYDSDYKKIIAKELRRDFNREIDDNFIVLLDTYHDKRNAFMFVINPIGARGDLQVFNNGGSSNAFWNGVWDVKTNITPEGWFAEIVIPLSTLKFKSNQSTQTWGINFERNIRRKREQVLWQGYSRDNRIEQVNQAGTLSGLENLNTSRFLEVKPYAIGGAEFLPNKTQTIGNLGGDINYLISPTYRLNITANTDFAQVEADQQQVNLTRFPLFFPELREFFLEGQDFFDMGFGGNRIIPFYSRNIGLNSKRETVPIIGGARLLGKENNSTLGLMTLQTAAASGEESSNYSIGSWRQDVGAQSVVGAMTVNEIQNGRWHSTTGVNGRYSTSSLFGNKNFDVGGAYIQNYNSDTTFNQMAHAWRVFMSYPNDKVFVFLSAQRSPGDFDPEVGLMLRRNFREGYAQIALKPRPTKRFKWIRQFDFSPGILTYTAYDDNGKMQSFEYKSRFFAFDTRSADRIEFNYLRVGEGLVSDFAIRENVVIPTGEYWWNQWEGRIRTFRGRVFSLDTRWVTGEFYSGYATLSQHELLWRTSKYLNLNLRYERNWIRLPEGAFDVELVGIRSEYAINPYVFGSLLTQWNNAQDEINVNFRLQIIPKVGTDFFLIFNQIYDTQQKTIAVERSTIIAKLIWRFVV